jgi:hypothetical protein
MTDQTKPSSETDKETLSGLEELRFAKTQQWRIATSAITLLAAIFAVAHAMADLKPAEKVAGTLFAALVSISSSWFLCSLQSHLKRTRLEIGPEDKTAWLRGLDVIVALIGAVILSGGVVVYFLWRGSAGLEVAMTYASALSIAGLLMNLGGVILLFGFGMPFRVRTGGYNFLFVDPADPKDVRAERWYGVLGWFGLALIVLGTAAQISAIFLSTH